MNPMGGVVFQNALSSNWQLFHSANLMAHDHLPLLLSGPYTHAPDPFVLPLKNSDRPKGQSEKCWRTIFSIPGSARLEFTTFENPPLSDVTPSG